MSEQQPREVVDAHHHLWDLEANHYPWLTTEAASFPLPNFQEICHDYLLADFRADAARQNVVKSIHVQAEHDARDPVRETAWLQGVADARGSGGFPHGIVAYADLADPGVEAVLAAHRAYPNVRGIRQSLNRPPEAAGDAGAAVAQPAGDLLADAGWRQRFGLLRKYELSFDMQLFPWQHAAGSALAAQHPDIQILLDHTGMPVVRGEEGLALWRQGMRGFAACPNVAVKISGLGMCAEGWRDEQARALVAETLDLFGPERCLFASNYPVDRLMQEYDVIWGVFREAVAAFSPDEQRALLRGNAERLYRV